MTGHRRLSSALAMPTLNVFIAEHLLQNFGPLDGNNAARPHQIKIESNAASNKPRGAHAPYPRLEIYNARFVHFFLGSEIDLTPCDVQAQQARAKRRAARCR